MRTLTADGRERLERFAGLRREGLTIAACAEAMGVTLAAAGHWNALLIRRQRAAALAAIVDWPVPSPPREPAAHWGDRSACLGHWELFYAPEGQFAEPAGERVVRERKALSLCAVCPVRTECLGYALEHREKTGIFGGLNEAERARLKRRRSRRGEAA